MQIKFIYLLVRYCYLVRKLQCAQMTNAQKVTTPPDSCVFQLFLNRRATV